jgi:hypothetical protein
MAAWTRFSLRIRCCVNVSSGGACTQCEAYSTKNSLRNFVPFGTFHRSCDLITIRSDARWRIISHGTADDGQKVPIVRWHGYSADADAWEPADAIP